MNTYLAEFQLITNDANGNTRAILTIHRKGYWESTDRRGKKIERCEYAPKVRIVGFKSDVYEIADSLQMIGCPILNSLPVLKSVPKSYTPTLIASEVLAKYVGKDFPKPHQIIAMT